MQKLLFNKILFLIFLFPVQSFSQDITGIWTGLIYADTVQKYLPYEIAISDIAGKLDGYSQTTYKIDGKEEVKVREIKITRKNDHIIFEDLGVVSNNSNLSQPKGIKKISVLAFSMSDGEILLTGEWSTNGTKEFAPMHGTIQLLKENDYSKTSLFKQLQQLNLTGNLSFVPKEKKTEPITKDPEIIAPAAEVASRKIAGTQTVFYRSDSLLLTLYDNGEVDGDIVSVLMNGKIIFAKQELSTRANSKTIYITKETPDSVMLVMYAENLGSIPPNTGLLVIHDGNDTYDLRFSADLKTNAAIILRRKR